MFKGKEVKVSFIKDAKLSYLLIKQEATIKKEAQILKKSIDQAIDILKKDPQFGSHIRKSNIPIYYIKKYNVKNLWKYNLSDFWRLIYTIDGKGIKIICFVLELFNHKEYNKRFKYKNK